MAEITGDAALDELHDELAGYPGVVSDDAASEHEVAGEIVLPLHLRHGEAELTFVSTVATFGTALDITLAELSVEAFYPGDGETAAVLAST